MRRFRPLLAFLAAPLALAACTTRPAPVPVAAAPPPAPPAPPPPTGYGNLQVPPRLADGAFATPNHALSAAGAVWHLRAGLNVAALSCRGPEEAALVAAYNALLAAHRADFAAAYAALGREHGGVAAFDDAMTRLYNYYALPPAQAGLCAAARAVLADAAALPAGGLGGFAPAALARLDDPYTTVFARQEAWLASRAQPQPQLLAAATPLAAVPPAMRAAVAVPPAAPAAPPVAVRTAAAPAPRLAVDPAIFAER